MTDYKRAFYIACDLLNGDVLYGIDTDKIFTESMDKDGWCSSNSYRNYILTHMDKLDKGEYKEAISDNSVLEDIKSDMVAMLTDIQSEIRHFMYDVNPSSSESDYACNYMIDIIQQKINSLKAESEPQESEDK